MSRLRRRLARFWGFLRPCVRVPFAWLRRGCRRGNVRRVPRGLFLGGNATDRSDAHEACVRYLRYARCKSVRGFSTGVRRHAPCPPPKPRRLCLLQKQTPPSFMSGWRDLNPRPLRPERRALPGCATPRGHAGNIALSGQSGNISRRTSRNHTRLILQSQFEVVHLVSLNVIARPSRRAGRATELRHTPRSCGQYSPVGTERKYKPPGQSQPYPPDTSIAIRSRASRLAQCDSTTFPPCGTRYRAAPHPEIMRAI